MKFSIFIITILFGIVIAFPACQSKQGDPATQPATVSSGDSSSLGPNHDNTPIPGNTEQHFICPNHCKGSGGPQEGICPVCGSAYVHNDAFHKGGTPIPEPQMKIDPVTHAAVPTHTEAQNSKGVYHFICPKGHPGGAGVAGNCPKCGTPLEHNQAFHNN